MSETEKKVQETIAEALPKMTDKQRAYLLGYAEAIAELAPDREDQGEKKEEKAAVTTV